MTETNYDSFEMDACECGEVYRLADGHRCNARQRLRTQHKITSAPFRAKPVPRVVEENKRVRW